MIIDQHLHEKSGLKISIGRERENETQRGESPNKKYRSVKIQGGKANRNNHWCERYIVIKHMQY